MTRDEAKRRMNLVRMYYKNMVDAFQPAIDCVDGSEELKGFLGESGLGHLLDIDFLFMCLRSDFNRFEELLATTDENDDR